MIAENESQDNRYDDPKLLTVAALAALLSVSVRQTHRMNRAGLIPIPLRIGGCVRWREDEISRWLKAGAPPRAQWEQQQATQTVGHENT